MIVITAFSYAGHVSYFSRVVTGPLVSAATYAVTIVHLLAFGIATGGYLAVAWSPFLLLVRFRRLFALGPAPDWVTNYLLVATAFGILHVLVGLGVWLVSGLAPIEVLAASGVGLAVAGMLLAGVLLPQLGYRWVDGRHATTTAMALLGGAIWYVGVTVIPPFVLWAMVLARGG